MLPDGLYPLQLAVARSKYWVLAGREPIEPDTPGPEFTALLAIDIESGEISSEVSLPDFPSLLIADEEAVWVAHWGSGAITRIDPATGEVIVGIQLELPFDVGNGPDKRLFIPNDLALGHGSLWVSTARGAIARIDTATNDVEIIELEPKAPGQIAVDSTGIWISENGPGLRYIDAETKEATLIGSDELGHSASQILLVGDILYVVGDLSLSRVDIRSQTVTETIPLSLGSRFLGWVEGRPGIVDASGVFQALETTGVLADELLHTDWDDGWPFAQVGKEAWIIESNNSLLRRLRLTESAGFSLPFLIDDELEPRPISDEVAVSGDWIELDRGPIEPRWPAIATWTGEEIVIWGGDWRGGSSSSPLEGGAAYRPTTDSWRMMSDIPLPAISEPGWVWTGDELLVWDGRGEAAAWGPDSNSWRVIDDWPLAGWFYRRSVWTGEEILDVFRDIAVDPRTGESRSIADSPPLHQRASLVWADGYMVSVTGEGSYHLASDRWMEMAPSGLLPLAVDGTAIGSEVVAVDYDMSASAYNPVTNNWSALPDVPLRFFECAPRTHALGDRVVLEHCAGLAVLDSDRETWTPLAYPLAADASPPTVITTDEDIYVWGTGFFRLKPEAIDDPSRIAIGTSYLDLPDGWILQRLGEADIGEVVTEVVVEPGEVDACLVSGRHLNAVAHLRLLMGHAPTVTEVHPYVGGEPAPALYIAAGKIDDSHHLTWATSTSDLVDVACGDLETLNELAPRVWSPSQ